MRDIAERIPKHLVLHLLRQYREGVGDAEACRKHRREVVEEEHPLGRLHLARDEKLLTFLFPGMRCFLLYLVLCDSRHDRIRSAVHLAQRTRGKRRGNVCRDSHKRYSLLIRNTSSRVVSPSNAFSIASSNIGTMPSWIAIASISSDERRLMVACWMP